MSTLHGPRGHYAGIVHRTSKWVDIQIRNDPTAIAYRVWASRSLSNLYGDPVGSGVGGDPDGRKMLFEVRQGKLYMSPSLVRSGFIIPDTPLGDTTRAVFTVDDFNAANDPPQLPVEGSQFYLAIQHVTNSGPLEISGGVNNEEPILGPTLVVPSVEFGTMLSPTLTVSGSAPLAGGSVGTEPYLFDPTLHNDGDGFGPPLSIVFPRPTTSLVITNEDADDILLMSKGWTQPYISIAPGAESRAFGSVKELFLSSVTNNPVFSVVAVCGQGS